MMDSLEDYISDLLEAEVDRDEEREDIPIEPDVDFISDVPDEFPGGF